MTTIEEIENYIASGSRSLVCIYRETLKALGLFVVSFFIIGKSGVYVLCVKFDPIDMVDDGEGQNGDIQRLKLNSSAPASRPGLFVSTRWSTPKKS
jgi:hypothetical protein